MKPQRRMVFFLTITLLMLFLTYDVHAEEVLKIARFSSRNFDLKVLTADSWQAAYGKNLKVPQTDEDVLALARQIYPPLGAKPLAVKGKKWHCGDMEVKRLLAALQNPSIKDATRQEVDLIIIQATPDLPEMYSSGHFNIRYTTTDPDLKHNVTLAYVKALAANLNADWEKYAAKFTEPLHYHDLTGDAMIDIYVYYIDDTTWGQTSDTWNYIDINSWILDIPCTRKITASHEMFHRVQFAYGYGLQGYGDDWLVEGTATWSEKYRYPTEREYMDWMDTGIITPTADLFAREYDAVHLFVYLTERSTWQAVRDIWVNYGTQGAEEAFKNAVQDNTGRLYMDFLRNWHTANYVKDLTYAPAKYDYEEDEVKKIDCAGYEYGPLTSTAVATIKDSCITPYTVTRSVGRYAADYVVFEMPTNPKYFTVEITGGDDFAYRIIPVKGKSYLRVYDGDTNPFTFTRPPASGKWTKVAVLVVGGSTGGNYTVALKDNLNGVWTDNHGFTWLFTNLSGQVEMTSVEPLGPGGMCGIYYAWFYNNLCGETSQINMYGFQPSYIPDCFTNPSSYCCYLEDIDANISDQCTITGSTEGSRSVCYNNQTWECVPGPMCCLVRNKGPYRWTFTKENCP